MNRRQRWCRWGPGLGCCCFTYLFLNVYDMWVAQWERVRPPRKRHKRHGFSPWVRKIPWSGNSLLYSCLENSMDKGASRVIVQSWTQVSGWAHSYIFMYTLYFFQVEDNSFALNMKTLLTHHKKVYTNQQHMKHERHFPKSCHPEITAVNILTNLSIQSLINYVLTLPVFCT